MKKENKFSRSPNFDFTCIHFNIYEFLERLEKPLWLINTKFKIVQICSINAEGGVLRWSVKMVFSTVSQNSQEIIMWESFIKKVTGYWLIKKTLRM